MIAAESTGAGSQNRRPKSGRTPLQPRNFLGTNGGRCGSPKAKPKPAIASPLVWDCRNKENAPPNCGVSAVNIQISDASSLAEELCAARKKVERLKLDEERTEIMLRERDRVLEMQMMELRRREEAQKLLEMEVDRLYRLKQLKELHTAISPIRSLREKERDKKIDEASDGVDGDVENESVGENSLQSPSSVSAYKEIVMDT